MGKLFHIRDAAAGDMPYVNSYALAEGMDVMPSTEGIRVAVNDEDVPIGFCRLAESVSGIAYVNPIVVHASWRGYGVGRALIQDAHERAGELRLISRGSAAGFYRVLGFEEMPWSLADFEAASEDCDNCPMFEDCHPVPMRLL